MLPSSRPGYWARLQEWLQDPGYRLVTLAGEGGVGKTRLSLAVTGQLLGHFPQGVRFVSLAGLVAAETPAAPDSSGAVENQIATAIGSALGITLALASRRL